MAISALTSVTALFHSSIVSTPLRTSARWSACSLSVKVSLRSWSASISNRARSGQAFEAAIPFYPSSKCWGCRWASRLVRHLKASLSLAATEENIRLHLELTVCEERRHPPSDIFSHGLPCGAGES